MILLTVLCRSGSQLENNLGLYRCYVTIYESILCCVTAYAFQSRSLIFNPKFFYMNIKHLSLHVYNLNVQMICLKLIKK